MKDDTFFRGIRGPVGSGKSVGCCVEVFRRALNRRKVQTVLESQMGYYSNTNPQLRTTTLKTWLDWFPEADWGKVHMVCSLYSPYQKGDIDLEVIFLALDRPEDVKKLLSLELTGIWINEAREIPKSIIDACTMRVGRYPSMRKMEVHLGLVLLRTQTHQKKITGGLSCLVRFQFLIIFRESKLRC